LGVGGVDAFFADTLHCYEVAFDEGIEVVAYHALFLVECGCELGDVQGVGLELLERSEAGGSAWLVKKRWQRLVMVFFMPFTGLLDE
jgi:hypothetical protein